MVSSTLVPVLVRFPFRARPLRLTPSWLAGILKIAQSPRTCLVENEVFSAYASPSVLPCGRVSSASYSRPSLGARFQDDVGNRPD